MRLKTISVLAIFIVLAGCKKSPQEDTLNGALAEKEDPHLTTEAVTVASENSPDDAGTHSDEEQEPGAPDTKSNGYSQKPLVSPQQTVAPSQAQKAPLSANPYERPADWREQKTRDLAAASKARAMETARIAKERGLSMRIEGPNGKVMELSHFEGEKPIYRETRNANAAISTGVDLIRDQSPFVDGAGLSAGVWDGGSVRSTHVEFEDRVNLRDSAANDDHATHVAGTIGAAGVNADAKGMAPAITIESYDWNDDRTEMQAVGASYPGEPNTLYLSNHSYGYSRGWAQDPDSNWNWRFYGDELGTDTNGEEEAFGRYSNDSAAVDGIAETLPYYLIFWAAGNDRNDGPTAGSTAYTTWNGTNTVSYDPAIHPLGDGAWRENGYENIADEAIAKNVLTIGAVNDAVLAGTRDVANATMSGFSTWGPADDGRVKPELVANGVTLRSTLSGTDSQYGIYSGTSMATPNATGSAALLIHYFDSLFPGHAMRASTLKGLLIHSADDLGTAGPDYQTGFGLINVRPAVDLLEQYATYPGTQSLREGRLSNSNSADTLTFSADGTEPVKITLSWTDPEGTAGSVGDDRTPVLVHDLDVRVTDPDGTTHFPYVLPFALDSANLRSAAAVQAENDVDPVEHIHIPTPVAGDYTITVDYDGALSGASGEQPYSLILSGFTETATAPMPTVSSLAQLTTGIGRITGNGFLLGANVVLSKDGLEVNGTGIQVNPDRIDFRYNTAIVTNLSEWTATVINPISPLTNPLINLSSTEFDYTGDTGTSVPDQMLILGNSGIDSFNYQITSNSEWLTTSPQSGTIQADPETVTLSVDTTDLSAGIHYGQLTITSTEAANAPRTMTYTLNLLPASIEEALESTSLTFNNDITHPWVRILDPDAVNYTAVATPPIGNQTTTTLQTSITGPGLLVFDWKVDSETDFDFLRCYLDGVMVAQISGLDQPWDTQLINIPEGSHVVDWRYEKDAFLGEGADRGWLDNVQFVFGQNVLETLFSDGFNSSQGLSQWTTEVLVDTTGVEPALDIISASTYPTGFNPAEGDGFLRFNSYDCQAGDSIRLKTLAPVSTAGYEYIRLSFDWTLDSEYAANDYLQFQWSTDGITWTDFGDPYTRYRANGSNEWLHYELQLPSIASTDNVYLALVFTGDYGYDCHLDDLAITGLQINEVPTAIAIDDQEIAENQDAGTAVGLLTTSDADPSDTHTYSLVAGSGDTDNGFFTIDGDSLVSAAIFDFETKSSYLVRIRSTDAAGAFIESTFTITVTDTNDTPTAIALDNQEIAENQNAGTAVGLLTTTDADPSDTHTYSLVAGSGDTDNGFFTIDGDSLVSAAIFDFETKSSYVVRIRSTDTAGAFIESTFTITVTDTNDTPTAIALDNQEIAENQDAGTAVGLLTTTDADTGDTHTYSLVAGSGDTDNGFFTIDGDSLVTAAILDYESGSSLSVRIRSTDAAGAFIESTFTITVTDTNDTPTAIALDNQEIAENQDAGTAVGLLTTTDADVSDSHTYSLVAGSGDTDNGFFTIDGDSLVTAAILDYESGSPLSVRIRSTDAAGAFFDSAFTITITDINEAPTLPQLSSSNFMVPAAAGTPVGTISASDPDTDDTLTYSLSAGTGDTDNGLFQIVGNELQTAIEFTNFGTFSIRITTTDSGNLTTDSVVAITALESATISFDGLQQNYDGDPKPVAVITDPAHLAVAITYDGANDAPVDAGEYAIQANITEPGYVGTASETLIVEPAPVSFTLNELSAFYDGAPKPVSVTTDPVGIPYDITYDDLTDPPSEPGTYTIVVTSSDSNYTGTTSADLVIAYAQTISLVPPSSIPENRVLEIPVVLDSQGDIAGLTVLFTYNSTYLRNPSFTWNPSVSGGFQNIDEKQGTVRILNVQSAGALPIGSIELGKLSFITRSGPADEALQIGMTVESLSDSVGNNLSTICGVANPAFNLTQRAIIGDANNNGQLDISDAVELIRLILSPDVNRPWDIDLNDLNGDSALGPNDIIVLLSSVAGLNTQPTTPTSLYTPMTEEAQTNLPPRTALAVNSSATLQWTRSGPTEVTAEISLPVDEPGQNGLGFVLHYPADQLQISSSNALSVSSSIPADASVVWNVSPNNDYANQTGEVHLAASWGTSTTLLAETVLATVVFQVQESATPLVHFPLSLVETQIAPESTMGPGLPVSLQDTADTYSRSYTDWALSVFGDAATDASLDADGDGQSNYMEYLASSDPTDSTSRFSPTYEEDEQGNGFQIRIPSVYGVTYQLQSSTDLQTWTPVGSDIADPNTLVGDDSILNFTLPAPGTGEKSFYRIELVP
jgi:hypothetical protein